MTMALRKSNFTLGDNRTEYITHTDAAHQKYTINNANSAANRAQLKSKM